MSGRATRRAFLQGLSLLLPASLMARADVPELACRDLELIHTHTGKRLSRCFACDEGWQEPAIAELDALLADHRSGEQHAMDRRLYELLHALALEAGLQARYEVISAYRSPATNAMLAAQGAGVSASSLHMLGQAIDVRLQGLPSAQLFQLALEAGVGGVGFYRKSDFVHLDTGRVRSWEG